MGFGQAQTTTVVDLNHSIMKPVVEFLLSFRYSVVIILYD